MFAKIAATAVLALTALSASATVITIQPNGAAGKDAAINNGQASQTQNGNSGSLTINYAVQHQDALIEFDLTPYLGQTAFSAYLSIYSVANTSAGQNYSIHANNGAWDEATVKFGTAPSYGPMISSITTTLGSKWYTFDVTSTVHGWLQGAPNYGFRLHETNGITYFASSDNGNALIRPKLVMDAAQVPEPASMALFALALLGAGVMTRRRK